MKSSTAMMAIAALSFAASSFATVANDGKTGEPAASTAPVATKVKPHSHLEAKGLGAVATAATQGKPAKPLHDHRKEHK